MSVRDSEGVSEVGGEMGSREAARGFPGSDTECCLAGSKQGIETVIML